MRKLIRRWLGLDQVTQRLTELGASVEHLAINKASLSELEAVRRVLGKYVDMAVDVGLKHDQTIVIVMSQLAGGRVQVIPCRLKSVGELQSFVRSVKEQFGHDPKRQPYIVDSPYGGPFKDML